MLEQQLARVLIRLPYASCLNLHAGWTSTISASFNSTTLETDTGFEGHRLTSITSSTLDPVSITIPRRCESVHIEMQQGDVCVTADDKLEVARHFHTNTPRLVSLQCTLRAELLSVSAGQISSSGGLESATSRLYSNSSITAKRITAKDSLLLKCRDALAVKALYSDRDLVLEGGSIVADSLNAPRVDVRALHELVLHSLSLTGSGASALRSLQGSIRAHFDTLRGGRVDLHARNECVTALSLACLPLLLDAPPSCRLELNPSCCFLPTEHPSRLLGLLQPLDFAPRPREQTLPSVSIQAPKSSIATQTWIEGVLRAAEIRRAKNEG